MEQEPAPKPTEKPSKIPKIEEEPPQLSQFPSIESIFA